MKIKEFGGEFKLIEALTKEPRRQEVVKGVGDDCAVFEYSEKEYMIVTTDMIVDNDHFSREYFSPEEIGIKLVESNVSDIAAMGGYPVYAFIGMTLKKETEAEWVASVYKGVYSRSDFYGFDILGGDTTHGDLHVFSLTLVGRVAKEKLTLRSGAKEGDVVKVTGALGASTAGFRLYQKKYPGHEAVKFRHRNPKCRLDVSEDIAKYASAMIDISDGLSADLGHILEQSSVGAVLDKNKIPIEKETFEAAAAIGEDAYDYAFYGGEDFELVYTVSKENKERVPGIEIGEVIKEKSFFLRRNGIMKPFESRGFNHFG